jgi:tetratricopeptide (TPR) repeat protein
LVSANSQSVDALNALGEAESVLPRALALAPRDAALHNNLGNILRDCCDLAAAEQAYRQAVALNRDYPEAYYNLGIVLQRSTIATIAARGLQRYDDRLHRSRRAGIIKRGPETLDAGCEYPVIEKAGVSDYCLAQAHKKHTVGGQVILKGQKTASIAANVRCCTTFSIRLVGAQARQPGGTQAA